MIDTFTIRCNIIHLAFSGKLTKQFETDGNADDMLSRINSKKNIVQNDKIPYEIPKSWAWVKLADLYEVNPKVKADDKTESAFVPMERISAGFDRVFTYEKQNWECASRNHTKFANGDVAFAKITPCFENRKSFIAEGLPNGIGGGTTELIVLRQKEMLPKYTYYLVLDQRFITTGVSSYKGSVGQQRVQSDIIKNYLIPVAPYSEQKRIVEQIEQAFSVLDTIDDLQAKYANNLSALKSKLIDAAIQGKLTKQLTEEGTAEELYQQIQAEKQELIKAGKIKKEKPLPSISEDEIPFEIPKNWKWVRLPELCTMPITDGTHQTPTYSDKETGIPFLSAKDVTSGKINWSKIKYITKDLHEELHKRLAPQKNDILLAKNGTTGVAALVENDVIFDVYVTLAVIRPNCKLVLPEFLLFAINSQVCKNQFNSCLIGIGVPNLHLVHINKTIIPLPPLAEQKRIVEKLQKLLAVYDSLLPKKLNSKS